MLVLLLLLFVLLFLVSEVVVVLEGGFWSVLCGQGCCTGAGLGRSKTM